MLRRSPSKPDVFPTIRKTPIEKPVFIIAPPRSGTSFRQNVLSQDAERFVYWQMYQTLFPCVCLQKLIDAAVGVDDRLGRTLLLKSTHSSGAVESLLAEFPDARFITIVRHPYDSVASHVSLFVPAWQAHSPDIAKDGPEARAYAGLAVAWYRHLFRFRDKVAPEHY